MLKRICSGFAVAFIILVVMAQSVSAAPSNVAISWVDSTSTTVTLTWVVALSSNSTVVVYRTDRYPASPTDGTSANVSTPINQMTITGLALGQTYFLAVWGWDGSSYSASPALQAVTTLAANLPSGGAIVVTNNYTAPTVPAAATSNASISGFNLEPFTTIIAYFNNAPGGLGMPVNNAWESFAVLGITFPSIWIYKKTRQLLVAYIIMMSLTWLAVGIHLMQWYALGIEIAIGLGVWALERFFQ